MSAGALLAVAALALPEGARQEEAFAAALAEGRLVEAAELVSSLSGEARWRAASELRYAGGDFEGALAATERALESAPADPALLWRGAGAALWLQRGELALGYVERLETALAARALASDERTAWDATVLEYRSRARELVRGRALRERAVGRGRAVSLAGAAASVAALLALALAPAGGRAAKERPPGPR